MIPTTLQEDAQKYAQFILENYPDAKQWHEPVMKAAWYISHGFAATVTGYDGEIVALLAARSVERPGLGVLPYYYNENGTCLHVDLWCDVSGDDRARLALKAFALLRWPQVKTIAMFRHFEESIRVYTLSKFWKSFEKIKRVRRKKENQLWATKAKAT
jgi:hypothetical protein